MCGSKYKVWLKFNIKDYFLIVTQQNSLKNSRFSQNFLSYYVSASWALQNNNLKSYRWSLESYLCQACGQLLSDNIFLFPRSPTQHFFHFQLLLKFPSDSLLFHIFLPSMMLHVHCYEPALFFLIIALYLLASNSKCLAIFVSTPNSNMENQGRDGEQEKELIKLI